MRQWGLYIWMTSQEKTASLYPVAAFKTFLLLLCICLPPNNHTAVSCELETMGQLLDCKMRYMVWPHCSVFWDNNYFHQADVFRLTYLWECVSTAHPHVRNMCQSHNDKVINQHHGPDLTLHVWPSLACWRAGGKESHILLDTMS